MTPPADTAVKNAWVPHGFPRHQSIDSIFQPTHKRPDYHADGSSIINNNQSISEVRYKLKIC